jgi:hypothetical protein
MFKPTAPNMGLRFRERRIVFIMVSLIIFLGVLIYLFYAAVEHGYKIMIKQRDKEILRAYNEGWNTAVVRLTSGNEGLDLLRGPEETRKDLLCAG